MDGTVNLRGDFTACLRVFQTKAVLGLIEECMASDNINEPISPSDAQKILIIDDNPINQSQGSAEHLQQHGFKVAVAQDEKRD